MSARLYDDQCVDTVWVGHMMANEQFFKSSLIWFFSLEFHFQLKVGFSLLIRVIWCFAGTVTLAICILVLHQ